jgi:hypothetical protein
MCVNSCITSCGNLSQNVVQLIVPAHRLSSNTSQLSACHMYVVQPMTAFINVQRSDNAIRDATMAFEISLHNKVPAYPH